MAQRAEDGKPLAGAMILLVPEDAEMNLPKFRRDQSDSDGTFTAARRPARALPHAGD